MKLVPNYLPHGEEDKTPLIVGKCMKFFAWKEDGLIIVQKDNKKVEKEYQTEKDEIKINVFHGCCFKCNVPKYLFLQFTSDLGNYNGQYELGGEVNGSPYYILDHKVDGEEFYLYKDVSKNWRAGQDLASEVNSMFF